MVKKGDTLVEVALAIGIFSMVAIAVVAVMNTGMSNAQTALETTLTREEIDTQAEALRFIQVSAAAENTENGKFSKLWSEIIKNALQPADLKNNDPDLLSNVYQFAPSSCDALYGDNSLIKKQKAFFIDPKKLNDDSLNDSFFSYAEASKSNSFRSAEGYPRIYYNEDNTAVAEGIFVVAVKDATGTKILGDNGEGFFYDFYIRTCWRDSGSDGPSTISTVIRLLGK